MENLNVLKNIDIKYYLKPEIAEVKNLSDNIIEIQDFV